MGALSANDRYVVISSDCHAGASMDAYRAYLEREFLDEYDAWRKTYEVPYADLLDPDSEDYHRNFDGAVRQRDLEGEGVVGEVLFPNTIPPFFGMSLAFLEQTPEDAVTLRRSWAGLRAHNRWLIDFCNELPGRRAGIAQIWANDIDAAVAEVRRVKDAGLFGGVLLPIPPMGSSVPPLHSDHYEPLWALCEDLEVPIHTHGGGGMSADDYTSVGRAMVMAEGAWYARRPLTQLILAGVFERHPRLRFAVTETGPGWLPETLRNLDFLAARCEEVPASMHAIMGADAISQLTMPPSGYFARNCWFGASFMGREDVELRDEIGVDRIMWANDYPHHEGTFPLSKEALRWTFQGVEPSEVQQMVGANAAALYGFDLDALAPIAAEIGPTVEELAGPMPARDLPEGSWSEAFATMSRSGVPFA